MLGAYGRRTLILPVVLALASGCRTLDRQRTVDDLRYKLRNQQHQLEGQSRQLAEVFQERDALKKSLEEHQLLLHVCQQQSAADRQSRDEAAQQLLEVKKQLEELARTDPGAFRYDPRTGSLEVAAEVLFRPGKTDLLPKGLEALQKVVPILAGREEILRIDGHTDADPIKYSKWSDNWQLAAERARTVLKFLESQGLPRERLFFGAYADTRPRAANDTPEGKRANRRVELVPLAPRSPSEMELRPAGDSTTP